MPRERLTDAQLAHLTLRGALGVNICMHGLARLPRLHAFADGMVKDFAGTALPPSFVFGFASALAPLEALIGACILLGIKLRTALAAGAAVMIALAFGTCLRQEWNVAGLQLVYSLAYFALLARLADARWRLLE